MKKLMKATILLILTVITVSMLQPVFAMSIEPRIETESDNYSVGPVDIRPISEPITPIKTIGPIISMIGVVVVMLFLTFI